MQVLQDVLAPPERCAYLPDREARLELRLILDVAPAELERFLARGWRRFGPAYFRPACIGCRECVSLRVPVATFLPSPSQRRAARRASALRSEFGVPRVDDARIDLYRRWHADRRASRGWEASPMDPERYALELAFPHPSARELALRDGDRLVAVTLVDETPEAMSAVYTYFDPELRRLSPGTVALLRLVEQAGAAGKRWVYLGYRVLGCASSEYKTRFRPHELQRGWPELDQPPRWEPGR